MLSWQKELGAQGNRARWRSDRSRVYMKRKRVPKVEGEGKQNGTMGNVMCRVVLSLPSVKTSAPSSVPRGREGRLEQ